MRYLTAIQPGSQNTHCMQHGQQCCHCYISQKWPTCIMTSLCKSAIVSGLGTSIHGVIVFLGSFYSDNIVIGRFIYGVVVINGSLYSWFYGIFLWSSFAGRHHAHSILFFFSHLRPDIVAHILTLANIHAHSNVIVMETCQGLLVGALLERMGGL